MRKLFSIVLLASLALAQAKPAKPATTAAPAQNPPAAARDAGVAPARTTAASDAGVPMPAASGINSMEIDRLRKDVNDLKMRSVEAERVQQQKADALSAQFEKLSSQLEGIKSQLTRVTDGETRRAEAEQSVVSQRSATASASASLNSVLGVLASGNTSGIEPSLRYAENVFTGNAQRNVQMARAALAQGDVSAARQYLLLALSEAEARR